MHCDEIGLKAGKSQNAAWRRFSKLHLSHWMAIFQAVSLGALPRGGGGRAGWDLVSKLCFNHKKIILSGFCILSGLGRGYIRFERTKHSAPKILKS